MYKASSCHIETDNVEKVCSNIRFRVYLTVGCVRYLLIYPRVEPPSKITRLVESGLTFTTASQRPISIEGGTKSFPTLGIVCEQLPAYRKRRRGAPLLPESHTTGDCQQTQGPLMMKSMPFLQWHTFSGLTVSDVGGKTLVNVHTLKGPLCVILCPLERLLTNSISYYLDKVLN